MKVQHVVTTGLARGDAGERRPRRRALDVGTRRVGELVAVGERRRVHPDLAQPEHGEGRLAGDLDRSVQDAHGGAA
jgi:hypothetical protein